MSADQINHQSDPIDKPFPVWWILILPFYAGGFLVLFIFPVAGDWRWLEGWLYVGIFALITGISYYIIKKKRPGSCAIAQSLKRKA